MNDRKVVLSSLWIFAMFNYLYADFFNMTFNAESMTGIAGKMSQGVILAWAVFMEVAIAMVVLSRVLARGPNRWANIIAGTLNTASVAWTLLGGVSRLYYGFFAIVEMGCTLFVIWYAWTWKAEKEPAAAG